MLHKIWNKRNGADKIRDPHVGKKPAAGGRPHGFGSSHVTPSDLRSCERDVRRTRRERAHKKGHDLER